MEGLDLANWKLTALTLYFIKYSLPYSAYPLVFWTFLDLKISRQTASNSSALIMPMNNYSITAISAYLCLNKWVELYFDFSTNCGGWEFLQHMLELCFRRSTGQKESHGTILTTPTTLAASVSSARNPPGCFTCWMRRASEFSPSLFSNITIHTVFLLCKKHVCKKHWKRYIFCKSTTWIVSCIQVRMDSTEYEFLCSLSFVMWFLAVQ